MKKMKLNCYVWGVLLAALFSSIGILSANAQDGEVFYSQQEFSMYETFMSGGVVYMSLISLCLVGVLLAAWKMPSRVSILGRMALIIGFGVMMLGLYQALGVLQQAPDVSIVVLYGGLKVALIAPIWGSIVYFVSLVVQLIQKPNMI